MTYLLTTASRQNYPGGEALTRFNSLYEGSRRDKLLVVIGLVYGLTALSLVHVHIDNLAAQTGASLFLHTHAPPFLPSTKQPRYVDWVYNKTEHLSPMDLTRTKHFTHAITEFADSFPSNSWAKVECVKGFDGFKVNRQFLTRGKGRTFSDLSRNILFVEFKYSEKLCILERK